MPQFQVAALYAFFALTLPGGQKYERLQLLPPAKEWLVGTETPETANVICPIEPLRTGSV
jgi:hypothetical protein